MRCNFLILGVCLNYIRINLSQLKLRIPYESR